MLTIIREVGETTVHTQSAQLLPDLLANREAAFWLDLEAPSPQELDLLGTIFHFHPLALEDAARLSQRPKVEEYDDFSFLIADEVAYRADTNGLVLGAEESVVVRQVAMFLGANFLVTVHHEPLVMIQELQTRCDRNHNLLDRGAGFLLYTLLDALVDGYFPIVEHLDDLLDSLEDRLINRPQRHIQQEIFSLKRDLTRLRRHVGPLREVLQTLMTRQFPCIQDPMMPYFRDVADHLFRVYESLDDYRDLAASLLEINLSQVNNEMNRVMQKFSAVATIFLPLTFFTGVFGMNFKDAWWERTNVWLWLVAMAGLGVSLYIWLRHRRWV